MIALVLKLAYYQIGPCAFYKVVGKCNEFSLRCLNNLEACTKAMHAVTYKYPSEILFIDY